MHTSAWFRILVIQQLRGLWVARGLEYDIAVEHRCMEQAIETVVGIARAHSRFDRRHGRRALSTLPSAPRWCWTAFQQAMPLRIQRLPCVATDAGDEARISIAVAPDGWAPAAYPAPEPCPEPAQAS